MNAEKSAQREPFPKKLKIILACLFCVIFVAEAQGSVLVKIADATSPDGKYTLEGIGADEDEGCRIEIKTVPGGKIVGRFSHGDFQASDSRYTISAVWNENSRAFALNITEGRNITVSRVFAENGGSWKEAALPEKAIARVRAKANTEGGKAQDYLSASEWMPRNRLKFSYQGNIGSDYDLIFRLVPGVKPRLEFVETIEPEPAPPPVEPKYDYENYVFTVLAGGSKGSQDGVGPAAQFKWPHGVAVDAAGNVLVGDRGNHVIRKVTADGTVSTLAGSADNYGNVDGVGAAARFRYPMGLAVDATGNAYVADSNNRAIRKVTPGGAVSTLADAGELAARAPGPGDPPAEPLGAAVDKKGNIYVAMRNDYIIRKIALDHAVTTLAGLAGTSGSADGPAKSARFVLPEGVAVDGGGNVYVADMHTIRKIDPSGTVTTLAGSADKSGRTDGTGSAAQFVNVQDVAVDSAGNVYVVDGSNKNIRKITPAGVVKTLRDVRSESPFVKPVAIAVDDKGWIYVADEDAFSIVVGKPAK